jgi:hypothetical protein
MRLHDPYTGTGYIDEVRITIERSRRMIFSFCVTHRMSFVMMAILMKQTVVIPVVR